ncbi:MAG: hypothetical protein K0Q70_2733, partial [Rhodospirillales bacterium]|nr:hypothetical protein [Rhodospirillales bacterium]
MVELVRETAQEVRHADDRIRAAKVEGFLRHGGRPLDIGRTHDDMAKTFDLGDRRRERGMLEWPGRAIELKRDPGMRLADPHGRALIQTRAFGGIDVDRPQSRTFDTTAQHGQFGLAFHLEADPFQTRRRRPIQHDVVVVVAAPEIRLTVSAPADKLKPKQAL